jgi:DNA repair exonuclease SbcCD nuclease subunit
VFVAGDFGHYPASRGWTPKLLHDVIKVMNKYQGVTIYVVPGQHDLIDHSLNSIPQTGIGLLELTGHINIMRKPLFFPNQEHGDFVVCPFTYGQEIEDPPQKHPEEEYSDFIADARVALAHMMVIDKPLWPGQKAPTDHELLKRYWSYDLIVTGDNHKQFTYASGDGHRALINPGSMMRMRSDQHTHTPAAYLWNAQRKQFKRVPIPVEEDVFHAPTQQEEELDRTLEAFAERLDDDENQKDVSATFEDNLNVLIQAVERRALKAVEKRVKRWIDGIQ